MTEEANTINTTTTIQVRVATKAKIEHYAAQLEAKHGRPMSLDEAINSALDLVQEFEFPL